MITSNRNIIHQKRQKFMITSNQNIIHQKCQEFMYKLLNLVTKKRKKKILTDIIIQM